jgi:deoxyribodipyrimidine photolyase
VCGSYAITVASVVMTPPAIMWFHRDLRLSDHPALLAAADAGEVLPLFVLDDRLLRPAGSRGGAFCTTACAPWTMTWAAGCT